MRAGFAGLLLAAGAAPAWSARGIVLGDSIGVGVSMASGLSRLAHNSVFIHSPDALAQIRRAPEGSVVFLSLGTNDAVGQISAGVARSIDRIVAAADAARVRLVWIGPVCVLKDWNKNVVKLDAILRQKLSGRATYVSVADQSFCEPGLHGGDGVHFSMRGYQMVWAKAQAAIDEPIEGGASVAPADEPPRARHKKPHAKKHVASKEKTPVDPAENSRPPVE